MRVPHPFPGPYLSHKRLLHCLLTAMLLILCGNVHSQNGLRVVSATGMGQTTGRIGTLTVKNTSKSPITIAGGRYYIPSDGKHQSYVCDIPSGITIMPNQTVEIPISGYCTDIHTPPVPDGEALPPFDTWVGVGSPDDFPPPTGPEDSPGGSVVTLTPKHVVPPFEEGDIPVITGNPGFKPTPTGERPAVDVTFPGTDIPVAGTIKPNEDPPVFAPVITGILDVIENATPVIQESGLFPTPFSNDPEREKETVIQQTLWIIMGVLTGDDYEKEDFAVKVYTQFEENAGVKVTALQEEQKEQLDGGVDAFWTTFTATGLQAKVISSPDGTLPVPIPISGPGETTEVPPAEKVDGCTLDISIQESGPDLDYAIANTGTQEMNEEVEEAFRAAIENAAGMVSESQGSDTVDVEFTSPEMPASAYSLWFPHAIAGRANAQAMHVDLSNPGRSAWTTEPLSTHAEGSFAVTLTHHTGENCSSTLIGINMAIVRASSSVGATLASPEVLAAINFVGELAIDFLIQRGKGTIKKLSKYLKDKVKDLAKDQVKEALKEEIERLARDMTGKTEEEIEQSMDELIEEIQSGDEGSEEEEQDDEEFIAEYLAELIIEGQPPEPPNPVEEFIDQIDSPVDWAPIKTNTYAIAQGALDIWVDEIHGQAKGASGVRYKREGLEANEEAVSGGGTFCGKAMKSKITSGTITLRTEGDVTTQCAATGSGIISTGHGTATGTIESFNGHFVIAICECPNGTFYDYYNSATSLTNEEIMGSIWVSVFENLMQEVVDELDQTITNLPAGRAQLPANTAETIKEKMEVQAARAAQSILSCN